MISKLLVIILLTTFISQLVAQENRKENGVKVGRWVHKDDRDLIYAEGTYNDGVKEGEWHYYVSSLSRRTHLSDVKGNYNSAGQKTGVWTFFSTQKTAQYRVRVDVKFVNGFMDGTCVYYNYKGNILATGLMSAGIRHGQWIFYHNGERMTNGFYQNGIKIGNWVYDYYPEPNMHVKGVLNFDEGNKNGKLEYYRVDHHPKFGTEELLSGVGTYYNGKKNGRWIEYNQGSIEKRDITTRGELVDVGNYNNDGKRQGYWKSTMERRNYKAVIYDNGVLNGKFILYHDNGKIKYETNYENGLPTGAFTRYYDNGNIEETGNSTFSSDPNAVKDTVYSTLEIPYEYYFQLVELRNFQKLNPSYVTWIPDPAYSVEPAELDRRFNLYKDYGLEPEKRIESINTTGKKSVRTGEYKAFFRNQKLKLEGSYYPQMKEIFFPETNHYQIDYARDGAWKEYDDNGYLIKTIIYDKGTFIKMLDDKGKEMGIGTNDRPQKEEVKEVVREEEILAPE